MLVYHYNQPEVGCRSPVWAAGHAVLCCAIRGSGTHRGIFTAELTGQPVPGELICSPAHQCSALGMHIVCFGHRKTFQETAAIVFKLGRRKAFSFGCA